MPLPPVFRTPNFAVAAIASAYFAAATLLLFGFILWQTAYYETARTDAYLRHEATAISREAPAAIAPDIYTRFANDLHRLSFAAVIGTDGTVMAGDIAAFPVGLVVDGQAHSATITRMVAEKPVTETARIVGIHLADGRILLVGRSAADLAKLQSLVIRALALGLLPGIVLALVAGILASRRALARIRAMNAAISTITRGQLKARLPTYGGADSVGQLAESVNRMLDDIERLVDEIRSAGDGIAHDVRTPLARARSRLETGRNRAQSQQDLTAIVDGAIADLDQCSAIITALLRIAELDGSQRRAGFSEVSLNSIVSELCDLYQPVAELNRITLECALSRPDSTVEADRDLLFEAAANVLDNAIKFTPAGGVVRVHIDTSPHGPTFWVTDSGPGIPQASRAAVLQRFARADRSRSIPGSGLGLALVAAILRLHGFRLEMHGAPEGSEAGFRVGIHCEAKSTQESASF